MLFHSLKSLIIHSLVAALLFIDACSGPEEHHDTQRYGDSIKAYVLVESKIVKEAPAIQTATKNPKKTAKNAAITEKFPTKTAKETRAEKKDKLVDKDKTPESAFETARFVENFLKSSRKAQPKKKTRKAKSCKPRPKPTANQIRRHKQYQQWRYQTEKLIASQQVYPDVGYPSSARVRVGFQLLPSGYLKALHLIQSSGYPLFDLIALRAIESAQPFPHTKLFYQKTTQQLMDFYFDRNGAQQVRAKWPKPKPKSKLTDPCD